MKLTIKQLDMLQSNAQSYIDAYGENSEDFHHQGPPTPSQTLAIVKEVKALRVKVKALKAGSHPRKAKKNIADRRAKRMKK